MKKLNRPFFRINIKGYYPEGDSTKLSANLYVNKASIIGQIIMFIAPFVVDKEKL